MQAEAIGLVGFQGLTLVMVIGMAVGMDGGHVEGKISRKVIEWPMMFFVRKGWLSSTSSFFLGFQPEYLTAGVEKRTGKWKGWE